MIEYETWRKEALKVDKPPLPEEEIQFLVGIISHSCTGIEDLQVPNNLTWKPVPGFQTIGGLTDLLRESSDSVPLAPGLALSFRNDVLPDYKSIGSLDEFGDRIVILQIRSTILSKVPSFGDDDGDGLFVKPTAQASEDEKAPIVKVEGLKRADFLNLLNTRKADQLESITQQALGSLGNIEAPLKALLENVRNRQAGKFLEDSQKVRNKVEQTKTIIGVCGTTGAGKSSLLNALLGEERVLPTSGLRACTAAATEIAWNDSEDPDELYRAEVSFISMKQWAKELDDLINDLDRDDVDDIDIDVEHDSFAQVVIDKIKALCPNLPQGLSTAELSTFLAGELKNSGRLREYFGATKIISAPTANEFVKVLWQYIHQPDPNKREQQKLPKRQEQSKPPELWPLVERVRIFLKAKALQTGAILVDLPGEQDSNAARAAVAETYYPKCSGLWIVSPIKRAVNDKVAQRLLGSSFKLQMKYDGTYKNVTFICSMTDDINLKEIMEDLGDDPEIAAFEASIDALEMSIQEKRKTIQALKESTGPLSQAGVSLKRAGGPLDGIAGKKMRQESDSHDAREAGFRDSQMTSSPSSQGVTNADREAIAPMIDMLRKAQKIQTTVRALESKKQDREESRTSVYVRVRNDRVRANIKKQFMDGLKSLDQKLIRAAGEDKEENDHVNAETNVFCVSSKTYQLLQGRMQLEKQHDGFPTATSTEIPQLEAYCIEMTEKNRIADSQNFLIMYRRLLGSLQIWASASGTATETQSYFLEATLGEMSGQLQKIREDFIKSLRKAFSKCIQLRKSAASDAAHDKALKQCQKWRAKPERGGIHWLTFRALVNREGGPFRSSRGPLDLNEQLSETSMTPLALGWDKCFQQTIPTLLGKLGESILECLGSTHRKVSQHTQSQGLGLDMLTLLDEKLETKEADVKMEVASLGNSMSNWQRETSRMFKPALAEQMKAAYMAAMSIRPGSGSHERRHQKLLQHLETHKANMFREPVKRIQKGLGNMLVDVEKQVDVMMGDLIENARQDYTNSWSPVVDQSTKETRLEIATRVNEAQVALDETLQRD